MAQEDKDIDNVVGSKYGLSPTGTISMQKTKRVSTYSHGIAKVLTMISENSLIASI